MAERLTPTHPVSDEMRSAAENAFESLGREGGSSSSYLCLLHLHLSHRNFQSNFQRIRSFAAEVAQKDTTIRGLIRLENWRHNLLGNAVAILYRKTEFAKDILWRMKHGSWVVPQLAAGRAIVCTEGMERKIAELVRAASRESDLALTMSLYSILKFRCNREALAFEKSDLFNFMLRTGGAQSLYEAETHWKFWRDVEPPRMDLKR